MTKIKELIEKIKKAKSLTEQPKSSTRRPYYPKFNFTNKNIDWAKWSWNPVTGCYHACTFCYAHDIANRFYEEKFEYTVHRERFRAPWNTKIPKSKLDLEGIRNVFVCSMADLLGDWVEEEVIQEILDICDATPRWTYIFLTKNPKRLLEFEFPKNSWVGATIDVKSRVATTLDIMPRVNAPIKFISFEPLLEDLEIDDLTGIDWIIIGACSKTTKNPEIQPDWEWVEKLHIAANRNNIPVYWKPNLKVRPNDWEPNLKVIRKEYPKN